MLAYLRSSGRARSWSEKQRVQNLWTKKGYDLAFKACDCKCGRGHLRQVDYNSFDLYYQYLAFFHERIMYSTSSFILPIYKQGVSGQVDSAFDSCLVDKGLNPAEAGHCVAAVAPTVPSGAEG